MEGSSNKDEVRHTLGDDYITRSDREWEFEDEDRNISAVIHFDERPARSGQGVARRHDRNLGRSEPRHQPQSPGRKVSRSEFDDDDKEVAELSRRGLTASPRAAGRPPEHRRTHDNIAARPTRATMKLRARPSARKYPSRMKSSP